MIDPMSAFQGTSIFITIFADPDVYNHPFQQCPPVHEIPYLLVPAFRDRDRNILVHDLNLMPSIGFYIIEVHAVAFSDRQEPAG